MAGRRGRRAPASHCSSLEQLTKRSEQSSGGCGRRGGTGVCAWYIPIPSTGRARLAVSAVVLLAALSEWMDVLPKDVAIHCPYPRRWGNACCGRHAAAAYRRKRSGWVGTAGDVRAAADAGWAVVVGLCGPDSGRRTGSRRIRAFGAWALTVSALAVLIAKLGMPVAVVAMSRGEVSAAGPPPDDRSARNCGIGCRCILPGFAK